jgi:uncharacterized protein YegP (UPF0339 family)
MRFVIYQDTKGEWRWSLKAKNNRIIGVSGEGYQSKRHTIMMCKKINAQFRLVVLHDESKAAV